MIFRKILAQHFIVKSTTKSLLIPFFCILKYLNKEESKVIFMQEFEINLFQF
jgi:hypothetical protein